MQVKKKASKKRTPKVFKKRERPSSLADLAKSKMPKWRVVDESLQDSPGTVEADAVSPKLIDLRAKTTAGSRKTQATLTNSSSDAGSKSNQSKKSGLVNMIPESEQDARLGAKTQVFEDDEHTGSQG
jgi:hypothetical protein